MVQKGTIVGIPTRAEKKIKKKRLFLFKKVVKAVNCVFVKLSGYRSFNERSLRFFFVGKNVFRTLQEKKRHLEKEIR